MRHVQRHYAPRSILDYVLSDDRKERRLEQERLAKEHLVVKPTRFLFPITEHIEPWSDEESFEDESEAQDSDGYVDLYGANRYEDFLDTLAEEDSEEHDDLPLVDGLVEEGEITEPGTSLLFGGDNVGSESRKDGAHSDGSFVVSDTYMSYATTSSENSTTEESSAGEETSPLIYIRPKRRRIVYSDSESSTDSRESDGAPVAKKARSS